MIPAEIVQVQQMKFTVVFLQNAFVFKKNVVQYVLFYCNIYRLLFTIC